MIVTRVGIGIGAVGVGTVVAAAKQSRRGGRGVGGGVVADGGRNGGSSKEATGAEESSVSPPARTGFTNTSKALYSSFSVSPASRPAAFSCSYTWRALSRGSTSPTTGLPSIHTVNSATVPFSGTGKR